MPPLKEIHFFDHLFIPENRTWTLNHIKRGVTESLKWHVMNEAINLDYFKYLVDLATVDPFTENWYRSCFKPHAANGKVLGDITPEYSTLPEEGVNYVNALLGQDTRIIYIIRNPVDRAISQLKMNLTRRGKENENTDYWIRAAKDPVIFQRGDYATYVPRWEKIFPRENILYLPYKQVQSDPVGFLARIEDHLGISRYQSYGGLDKHVHKTKKANVPTGALEYMQELLAPQSIFLKRHLGEQFYSMT